jgi:uncharacterized membrane protein
MKRGFAVLCAFVIVTTLASAQDLGFRSIRYDEYIQPGDEAVFFVSVVNHDRHDAEHVRMDIMSPDGLDIFGLAGSDEISGNEAESFLMPVDVPRNTEAGDYYVRFTVSDDDGSRSVYRVITIE